MASRVGKGFLLLSLVLGQSLWGEMGLRETIEALRERESLPPLIHENALEMAAREYARDLLIERRLTHIRGDEGPLARYKAAGGTSMRVGEILGMGIGAREVMAAWLRSPSHRDVLVRRYWRRMGIGMAQEKEKRLFVVLFSLSSLRSWRLVPQEEEFLLKGLYTSEEEEFVWFFAGHEHPHPPGRGGSFTLSLRRDSFPLLLLLGRGNTGTWTATDTLYLRTSSSYERH